MAEVYGGRRLEEYRARAQRGLAANLAHPQVRALTAMDGQKMAGLVLAVVREDVSEICFLHVLERYRGTGIERELVSRIIRQVRDNEGARAVVSECLPLCPLELGDVYEEAGFHRVNRMLMTADAASVGSHTSFDVTDILGAVDWTAAAACLAAAYADHPGRALHPEVRTPEASLGFIERVVRSHYGLVHPEYLRVSRAGGGLAGVVLSCELMSDIGFILQIATCPEHQGRGHGERLVRAACAQHYAHGAEIVALGVTADNPARRLYERLGFKSRVPVAAFTWWAEENS